MQDHGNSRSSYSSDKTSTLIRNRVIAIIRGERKNFYPPPPHQKKKKKSLHRTRLQLKKKKNFFKKIFKQTNKSG